MVRKSISKKQRQYLIGLISILIVLLVGLVIWQKNHKTSISVNHVSGASLSSVPDIKTLNDLTKASSYLNQLNLSSTNSDASALSNLQNSF